MIKAEVKIIDEDRGKEEVYVLDPKNVMLNEYGTKIKREYHFEFIYVTLDDPCDTEGVTII